MNLPVPMPTFSGELVAFEKDPAVRNAMDAVLRAYEQGTITRQAQLNQQYAALVAA